MKKYHVGLKKKEIKALKALIRKGQCSARRLNRAHILLMAHQGRTKADIAQALSLGQATVSRIRKKYVEGGLSQALNEITGTRGKKPALDQRQTAQLIAIACSNPPEGRNTWTAELLAEEMMKRKLVKTIGREAIRLTLKKRREAVAGEDVVHCGDYA